MGPLGRAAAAQVGASAAIGAAPVVERLLAVSLGVGAVSHLEYATRLLVIPAVMFEGALAPLLLARWTEVITREGRRPARDEVFWFVGKGILLAAAVAAVLFVVSPTLVRLLLGHGRFSAEDEASVSSLLRLLSLAFVATMGALLLERLYLASRKNHMLAGLSMGRALVRILTVWTLLPSSRLLAFPIGYAVADWCYLLALFALLGPITVGAERAASGS
jgi:peptidoglycan biosynthesis protein MviN/MurJ (putative lipid II flippase)